MSTPAEIARAARTSRGEFANIFYYAQRAADVPPSRRQPFDAVVTSATDRTAFEEAATFARDNRFDQALIDELIDSNRETGELSAARIAAIPGNAPLQAIHNAAQGFDHPAAGVRGLMNGMRWTGSVMVDLIHAGTGVLIAPHLFLTSWHVVSKLFDWEPGPPGRWLPKPASAGRLRIDFDAVALPRAQSQSFGQAKQVNAHMNWCAAFSPCHDRELDKELPADLTQLHGKWDYAVIQLSEPVGFERSWALMDIRVPVPKADEKVHIFQYPNGPLQRFQTHSIVGPTEETRQAVPRARFLHTVNSAPGSSGGPCFDREFLLFGLHQGVWKDRNPVVNRGIPMARICESIRDDSPGLPQLDPLQRPIWSLDDNNKTAVIGMDRLQAEVWAASILGGKPILNISGEPGSGKTLRVHVADQLLKESGHLKVVVESPSKVTLGDEAFARDLCKLAGAALPSVAPPDQVNSTLPLWRKDILTPAVLKTLDAARGGRFVWLLLKDLNHCVTFGEGTSELLYLLYEQTANAPWLRFILDGMQGGVAESVQRSSVYHPVAAISESEVLTYLKRRAVELELDIGTLGLPAAAKGLHRAYFLLWNDPVKRPTAARELAFRAGETMGDYLATAGF